MVAAQVLVGCDIASAETEMRKRLESAKPRRWQQSSTGGGIISHGEGDCNMSADVLKGEREPAAAGFCHNARL